MVFQTVSSVTTSDGRGDAQATTYAYQGAKWRDATAADPVREFLGFRKATTTLAATGAYSETYYWQRAGTIAKPEVIYKRKANGAIMSFEKFVLHRERGAALHLAGRRRCGRYECNGDGVVDANHNYVSGCRRVVTTYEWDTYANLTAEYQYGDYDVGGDERTAVRVVRAQHDHVRGGAAGVRGDAGGHRQDRHAAGADALLLRRGDQRGHGARPRAS